MSAGPGTGADRDVERERGGRGGGLEEGGDLGFGAEVVDDGLQRRHRVQPSYPSRQRERTGRRAPEEAWSRPAVTAPGRGALGPGPDLAALAASCLVACSLLHRSRPPGGGVGGSILKA